MVAQMVKNLPAIQESWVWSLVWVDPLEKGMATHSNFLTWGTPWTEEPGRLHCMGSQWVGQDWVTNTFTFFQRFSSTWVSIGIYSQGSCWPQFLALLTQAYQHHCYSSYITGINPSFAVLDSLKVPILSGECAGYPAYYQSAVSLTNKLSARFKKAEFLTSISSWFEKEKSLYLKNQTFGENNIKGKYILRARFSVIFNPFGSHIQAHILECLMLYLKKWLDQCLIDKSLRNLKETFSTALSGYPGGSVNKESSCNAGDLSLIPELRRSLGKGNGYLLQYSCLENPMDRGAWQATVHGVTKSWTQLKQLSMYLSCIFLVAQTVKRLPTMRETRVRSCVGKIPWRRKWQPTPVFLPGKSHGQRFLLGYSPWGCKESDTTEPPFFFFSCNKVGCICAGCFMCSFPLPDQIEP